MNRVGQLCGKDLDCDVKRLGLLYGNVLDWVVKMLECFTVMCSIGM